MIQIAVENNSLTSLAQKCKTLNQLKQLHAHLIKSHLPRNPYAIAPLLSVAATSRGDASFFPYACSIFKSIRHPNTFMYSSMIRGYVQSGSPVAAILCYKDMVSSGVLADNYTFPQLIKASFLSPDLKLVGSSIHAHVIKYGLCDDPFIVSSLIEFYSLDHIEDARSLFDRSSEKDVVVWTAMVDGYGKRGEVENARELFDKMPERNVISWSAIMAAHSRVNDFREVLYLFRQMQESGTKPNESGLVSVLTACAHLGAVAQGLWLHTYAKRYNMDSNPILATALVDMYSKCGFLDSAFSVFESIRGKDAGAWNAMISGVAMNGDAEKALDLFDKMISSGTAPTATTFVAILSACTHAKMVHDGLKIFKQMNTIHRVKPQFEHCACVVDLMSRAGMVEEAEKFMEEKMGEMRDVDVYVWGALLGACRTYGNIEVGNRVWKKLAGTGMADSGTHVLSYNMYAEAGWEAEARRVRSIFCEAGMRKKPGCSVIEVDGVVQEFLAGDHCHPRGQEVSKMLDSLSKMVKLEMVQS